MTAVRGGAALHSTTVRLTDKQALTEPDAALGLMGSSPPDKQRRPGWSTEAPSTMSPASDTSMIGDAIAYAVFVETTEGRESRRLYLSLHGASRAVERAEARGHSASMTLCALVPIGGAR